jgi:hypothetical protein
MRFNPQVIVNFEQRITLQVREPFGAKSIVAVSATRRQDEASDSTPRPAA